MCVHRMQRRSLEVQNRPAPGAGRPKPRPQPKPKEKLPGCRCMFSYDAQDTDELSFSEGDIIELVHEGKSLIFSLMFVCYASFSILMLLIMYPACKIFVFQ